MQKVQLKGVQSWTFISPGFFKTNWWSNKVIIIKKCPKKKAALFCQKRVCKVDSSSTLDGPTKHRILKKKYPKDNTTMNGWCSPLTVNYDLGG